MRAISFALAALAVVGLAACQKPAGGAQPGDMDLGNPNAKVTVIEYASAACPHCAEFDITVFPNFKKKYIDTGKVHYIFREYLTEPVPVAAAGFLLARCAGPGKYFDVLDAVFRSQPQMYSTGDFRGVLLRVAESFGMTEDQFTKCLTDDNARKALNARVQAAQEAHIEATPTFIIGGKKYEGEQSMAQLDAAIQPLLK